ncbi:hypothetical protein D0T12_12555 [Actinomadura spongiicola]|uniref:CBM2 domain-containing protein n=1 Tax=Actinomadura spongiicola TaxID=2303421 RepID=A0A372GK97_9ACTN|nr:cellulose binding domain-containing protein [Actinomadura spongiicola]RFS85800.1 hypothetical protein D0T12_12555 [Actinomadura spongiicola]
MDELSREEPGYTPPDHRTTAEFHVPDTITDPGTRAAGAGPESTVVDEPVDDLVDSDATLQDVPPDATLQDPPVDDRDEPEDRPSVTIADLAVSPQATASEPLPAEEPATDPATLPDEATMPDEATIPEEAGQAVMHEEAPWTAQFGVGAEQASSGTEASPRPAEGTVPPPFDATAPAMPPVASPSGGVPPSRSRRPLLLMVIGAALLLAAAVAMLLVTRGSETEGKTSPPRASTPAPEAPAPATPGGPNPSEAPATPPRPSGEPTAGTPAQPPASPAPAVSTAPIGPVVEGDGITYQLAQQDEGYFEGRMVITNRTDRPMPTWRLTFRVPGADVKNIWGARLVRGGENAEIGNLDGAPAIPPGGTWEIQFGAAGATTTPQACRLNDIPCGF